jgi:hypothetical protein
MRLADVRFERAHCAQQWNALERAHERGEETLVETCAASPRVAPTPPTRLWCASLYYS